MTLSIHIQRIPDDTALSLLTDLVEAPLKVTVGNDPPPAADYRILIGGRPSRALLEASAQLKAVIVPFAGIPAETRALLHDFPDVALHNLHHNAAPVAEMAIALLLAAGKSLLLFDRSLREHRWLPRDGAVKGMLFEGNTALILGYGAIGRRVARSFQALGMRVLATRRHGAPSNEEGVAIFGADALPQLLPRANVLIICLPLTRATEGLIGAKELALLPPGAVLVNVGRGPVVQQQPLYEALRDERLRAAGLDVWYNYPQERDGRTLAPPADYPFHELDNVVMSPHRAGGSEDTEQLRMKHMAQVLQKAARGELMPNRVDLERGY